MAGLRITSDYIAAANSMKGKKARRRIVAYVESYDDVFFWRMVLSAYEDDTRFFEVMLPTRESLCRGKRQAIMALMEKGAGSNLIACVDADYDYLIQGSTDHSAQMLGNPYIIHSYVYAIENFQCYAPSLHNVCVMATLNDHAIFDFEEFLAAYSRAVFPLLVWNIMLYRKREYGEFSISEMNSIISIRHRQLQEMPEVLEKLRRKTRNKTLELQRRLPGRKEEYMRTRESLISLGVTPETAYLYVQGHHLFDNVVAPTVQTVCDQLRSEMEREIKSKAVHHTQMHNEMSAYIHSQSDIQATLKKNLGFMRSEQYGQLCRKIEEVLNLD